MVVSTNSFRLGPSASQHPGDDKLAEVMKAFTLIQSVMAQPWAQQLLGSTMAKPVNETSEVDDAKNGLPSGSKPGITPTSPVASPASTTPTVELPKPPIEPPKPVVELPKAPAESPIDPPPAAPAKVINTYTHRASHARLVRRMEGMGEAECPNMTKLYNGNRKDGFVLFKCILIFVGYLHVFF